MRANRMTFAPAGAAEIVAERYTGHPDRRSAAAVADGIDEAIRGDLGLRTLIEYEVGANEHAADLGETALINLFRAHVGATRRNVKRSARPLSSTEYWYAFQRPEVLPPAYARLTWEARPGLRRPLSCLQRATHIGATAVLERYTKPAMDSEFEEDDPDRVLGAAVYAALIGRNPKTRVAMDIPAANVENVDWATDNGFVLGEEIPFTLQGDLRNGASLTLPANRYHARIGDVLDQLEVNYPVLQTPLTNVVEFIPPVEY